MKTLATKPTAKRNREWPKRNTRLTTPPGRRHRLAHGARLFLWGWADFWKE